MPSGRIFYILQKGLNEIITGLTAIDRRAPHTPREAARSGSGA
jgi:hypothetical protein